MNQGAAKAESENLEAEQVQAENGETSAGTEKQEAETKETEKETKESEAKDAKKDPKDAQIEELQDRLKRQMAEFDNFRKRTEKEKAAMYEIGAKDIIEKILPVLEWFTCGSQYPNVIRSGRESDAISAFNFSVSFPIRCV